MPAKKPNTMVAIPEEAQQAVKASESKAAILLKRITGFVIRDDNGYVFVANTQKTVKEALLQLDTDEKSITKPINAGLKAVRALFARPKEALSTIDDICDRKLAEHRLKLAKEAAEAQRVADVAAEKGRVRLLASAEKQAAKLEAKGKSDEAQELLETAGEEVALLASGPVLGYEPPKVEGLETRTYWEFEIFNALLVPDEYWVIDLKAIGTKIREDKEDPGNIPGVRAYPVTRSTRA